MTDAIRVTTPLMIAMTGCLSAVVIVNLATSRSLKNCDSSELIALAGALGTGGLTGAAGAMTAPVVNLPRKPRQEEK